MSQEIGPQVPLKTSLKPGGVSSLKMAVESEPGHCFELSFAAPAGHKASWPPGVDHWWGYE